MLQIRRYRDADHDAVFELHRAALDAAGAFAGEGPWNADLHAVQQVYLDGGGGFLVGLLGGRIVAMGAIKRMDETTAEVKRMRVAPDCQRRGFGRAILQRLERRAAELGVRTLKLDTTVAQVAAQRFYEAHGYRQTGRTTWGRFETLLYEKRLEAD